MQASPLRWFVVRVFILLPVMFTAWYFMGSLLASTCALLTEGTFALLEPGLFAEFKANGALLEVITRIPLSAIGPAYATTPGIVVFETRPMLFGYGTPFFLALFFAAPRGWGKEPWQLVVAILALVAIQLWGLVFDTYKNLLFTFGPGVAARLEMGLYARNFIAYGYQLGTLILPVIGPVALWFGLFNRHWRKLVGQQEDSPQGPRHSLRRR